MKRATPTPNRFTIFTPNWPVKGLVLFLLTFALGSCVDELNEIGTRKPTSRFGVYFREFNIPATTVLMDSINTSLTGSERILCGVADDAVFGKSTAIAYMQFGHAAPSLAKIDKTNRTNFQFVSLDMMVVLGPDLYVYGDSSTAIQNFTLHQIKNDPPQDFWFDNKKYISTKTFDFESTPLASGIFDYRKQDIKDHRIANADPNKPDVYDTIYFEMNSPAAIELGNVLLDTALRKGFYGFNSKNEWVFLSGKNDSVFRRAFPGFVIVPASTNDRILGFKTALGSVPATTRITLRYSYNEGTTPKTGEILYFSTYGPAFSNIVTDRTGTQLAGLTQTYSDFNAPDDYCYLQAGAGLYTKLDFSGVRSYFDAQPVDTLLNVALNAAELIIDVEPKTTRLHTAQPQYLYLRMLDETNHFYQAPLIQQGNFIIADPTYTSTYFTIGNGTLLDVLDDEGRRMALPLTDIVARPLFYNGFLTEFFSRFLRTPDQFDPIVNLAVIPGAPVGSFTNFGKSLNGVSFKKDKVKLRVYYTKAL